MRKIIFSLVCIFLLTGCQKEDNEGNETVSLSEAQRFFSESERHSGHSHNHLAFVPKWETFLQEGMSEEHHPLASVKIEFREDKSLEASLLFEKTTEGIKGKIVFVPKKKSDQKEPSIREGKIETEPKFSASFKTFYLDEAPELIMYQNEIEQLELKRLDNRTPKCDKCGQNIYKLYSPQSLATRFEKERLGQYDKELCDECNEKIYYLAEVVFTAKKKKVPALEYPFSIDIPFPLDELRRLMETKLFGTLLGTKDHYNEEGLILPRDIDLEDGENRHIYYEDIPPCVKEIVEQLEELNKAYIPSLNEAGSNIAPYILNLFKNSPQDHITFSKENLPEDENGYTITLGGGYYRIVLNENLLKKGSKLYIAKTIIHESVHALVFSELYKKGVNRDHDGDLVESMNELYEKYKDNGEMSKEDKEILSQHEFISHFVTAMSFSLKKFDNGRKPLEYYQYLLWDGLGTTDRYASKSLFEREIILKVSEDEKNKGGNSCY